jgi:hypothetical protein
VVSPIDAPGCGVVVSKGEQGDVICPDKASDMVTIVTEDIPTAVVLVCPRHSAMLDDGKELMFATDDPAEHILVQFVKGETNVTQ